MTDNDELVFHNFIDLTNIHDSMQLDSGTVIATLRTKDGFASLEVRGYVKVFWNPNPKPDEGPSDGSCYIQPSEFPQDLKDLIAGKTAITMNAKCDESFGKIKGNWAMDDRVYIAENNWFELFIGEDENDNCPISDCVDAEEMGAKQIFELMYDFIKEQRSDH